MAWSFKFVYNGGATEREEGKEMGGEIHSGFVVKSDGVQDGGCDHGRFER